MQSRISGFYRWPLERRRRTLAELTGLAPDALGEALDPGALEMPVAEHLIENVVGVLGVPVGLGLNFQVNGEDVLVPMAVEEPSVVAAVSNAARRVRAGGGFVAQADPPVMIGQIQLTAEDPAGAAAAIEGARAQIEAAARAATERLAGRGGGYQGMTVRTLHDPEGGPPMVVVHLMVDVREAMGANAVNEACERVAPVLARVTGLEVGLRILSNLADRRCARAIARVPVDEVGGLEVAARIAEADRFARLDPYRAATHNKGILNGIDAVALATGNDWRAIEAGAHAFAARGGAYTSLTRWAVDRAHLVGRIELPMAVGTVGGITRSHPTVALLRQVLGVSDARTLAGVFASVGLAQNLAALRALADEGIQAGHMALHARQLALAAGAEAGEVEAVVARVRDQGKVSAAAVAEALEALRDG